MFQQGGKSRIQPLPPSLIGFALSHEVFPYFRVSGCATVSGPVLQRTFRGLIVGITTGYVLDDRGAGVRVPVGSRIFSAPRRPDRPCGPHASYPMGTGSSFLRGVKMTTHLELVTRSRKCGSIHPLPHAPSWRSA
jgi:hypothetical protein